MTRVNLVPVGELANQHAMAEWRELKMIPKALARSLKTQSVEKILKKIPKEFTLNCGHVLFFYDKGVFLRRRYEQLNQHMPKAMEFYKKAQAAGKSPKCL